MRRFLKFATITLLNALLLHGQEPAISISPALARVLIAQKRVASDSKSWEALNGLAFALCRVGRDTGDVAIYEKARKALSRSLELSPGNYEARKLTVTVLLGEHEFAKARELAIELNHKVPDDISGWALLVDVNVAFGNYSEAERAAQWILDLRPGSTLGFEKAAGLRELFGDPEGATEFYEEALRRTAKSDIDGQSWLLTQDARQALLMGKLDRADKLLKQASTLFSDSQAAIAVLAQVRTDQGRYSEAAALFQQRYRKLESSGNLYDWAEALELSGQKLQAARAFQDFELAAIACTGETYNWNRQLTSYYSDHKLDAEKALRFAKQEISVREDWAALESYAWALYLNGKYAEAEKEMATVSAVGILYPQHLCHATQIAQKAGDALTAETFSKKLAARDTSSCPAVQALRPASQALP